MRRLYLFQLLAPVDGRIRCAAYPDPTIGSIVWSPESLKALGIDPEGERDMERARR